jgi:acetyl-CoA acetyltransferase
VNQPRGQAFVLGVAGTAVGRQPSRSFAELLDEAIGAALVDAGSMDPGTITHCWFSNVLMDYWGQRACRGQEALQPLVESGSFPAGVAIINVEAGCASGSVAFHEAWKHVISGQGDVALAVGVEKMNHPDRPSADVLAWMEGAMGAMNPEGYYEPYRKLAAELGTTFAIGAGRSAAMDIYGIWTKSHMRDYGTTVEQIAYAAAKNHTNAVDNPRAQYQFAMTTEEVLNDRVVSDPLTRAMCAPTGDAAAAVVICSDDFLRSQPAAVQARALHVRGHAIAGGMWGVSWEGDRAAVRAARDAYQMADLEPADLDLVELHDATSFGEILAVEDLGLCKRGEGGPYTASGATQRDGELPVNPSGGLVSRGHPLGATGILMLNEVALQLRNEAEALQIPNARVALAENGGGMVGHDAAVCAVTVLEASG